MRIVIDLQGAQTESRFRGIGRYTLSLAKSIARNKGKHEIVIALSDLFPDTIEPIRAAFDNLLPQENIRIWSAPGPVRECEVGNAWRRKSAELVREAFLASLRPDHVHIMSLFEGYADDVVTSIGRFDRSTAVSVTLYDLMPLSELEHYLKTNATYEQYYLRKISHIKRASLLLSISESARQEGIDRFGLFPESLVNISGAVDERFRPLSLNQQDTQFILTKFSIARPFLLYSGGFDECENLPRLIRAYAKIPNQLRSTHQLLLAGKIREENLLHFRQEAKDAGLRADEIIFTGYVNDEDLVKIYNLSKLCVLPSWHEGFGFSALEAMSCGRAIIGANATSILEVIDREDALFDPLNENSIAEKISWALTDEVLREELENHGVKQAGKFSWDKSAKKAIEAFERFHIENKSIVYSITHRKPTLAYISPLPPAQTGIADYSADLLPELARHYEIEVIVDQESVSDSWVKANIPIRDLEWFRLHAANYDRIIYHIGNSHFHRHMFTLLDETPGIVVLHDFFLSHALAYLDTTGLIPGVWTAELYKSHGYKAVTERLQQGKDIDNVIYSYPCNRMVLQHARTIVHSKTSRQMAFQWYGEKIADEWSVIPSLMTFPIKANRKVARQNLTISEEEFIVCSFGALGPTKLNNRILNAYLESKLAKSKKCTLIFVGENPGGKYGETLLEKIFSSGMIDRIHITGRVNIDTYRRYLEAADIGIQLRSFSRGETSRAVLECMSYGLATIVNAHGSMMDLPDDGVWKLPDEFSDTQLVGAMESLWKNPTHRKQLGDRAREVIRARHSPRVCADQYADAIEHFYNKSTTDVHALVKTIGNIESITTMPEDLSTLARDIAQSIPPQLTPRQLLLDVTELTHCDRRDGIHRVVRSLLREFLTNPPVGFRVEPVYAKTDQGYHYARRFTLEFLSCPADQLTDEPIEYQNGDIFFGLDWQHQIVLDQKDFYQRLRRQGISVQFLVYDLLPIQMPQFFPKGMAEIHYRWLKIVTDCDGAICISKTVANELSAWVKMNDHQNLRPFKISWSHNGADIEASVPTKGLPYEAGSVLRLLQARPTFLMIGTVEPRKGHLQTLYAFEQLWQEGVNINLVIVGAEGWKDLPNEMRRTIPTIANRLRQHPELGKRLFWLEGISDEYLEKVYDISTCLIAASEGEGFGLPLIEAAQHKLPIIARDIPVFREVAGGHAFYFQGIDSMCLVQAIKKWIDLFEINQTPSSDRMPWLTWKQSAEHLISIVCAETPRIQ